LLIVKLNILDHNIKTYRNGWMTLIIFIVVFIDKQRFPKCSSNFANPFKIDKDGTRDEVIQKYKTYIIKKLKDNVFLQKELIQMKGKNIGCWCFPEPCHGDVLLELIDNYEIVINNYDECDECDEKEI